jgi:hypothetical protein
VGTPNYILFFVMGIFDWPMTNKIKSSFEQSQNKYVRISSLGWIYRFSRVELKAKSMG